MPDDRRFEALLAIKQAIIAAGSDLDRIFEIVVDRSLVIIPSASGVAIGMIEEESLACRAATGSARALIGCKIGIASSFAGRSVLARTPILCPDVEQDGQLDPRPYRAAGIRSLMSVPLVRHGIPVGALIFYAREPGAFAARDLTIAELLASQLVSGFMTVAEENAARDREESAARFETIAETLPQLIWMMTPKGQLTYCNRRVHEFLGIGQAADFRDNVLSVVHPDFRGLALACWARASVSLGVTTFECLVAGAAGDPQWMQVHLAPITMPSGAAVREWIGVATNIDSHKAMELALQDAVRTRELLLYEVNHRVKNSLQLVTGLLALHASRVEHPEARSRLLDARAQIGMIAQVHRTIYQTSHHDKVELVGLLKDLATGLVGRNGEQRARLCFRAPASLLLPIDRGVPVALVAGEIITNAIKHGCQGLDAEIRVELTAEPGECLLEISDNGPGLPADFDPDRSGGLGMEIIYGLAQQAGGRIEIDKIYPGARFRLFLSALT